MTAYDFRATVEMRSRHEGGIPAPFLPGGRIGMTYRFPFADTRVLGEPVRDRLVGTYLVVDGENPLDAGQSGSILGLTLTPEILEQVGVGDPVELHAGGRIVATGVITAVRSLEDIPDLPERFDDRES